MKTVLGIGAHPDDLEISCGGTLVRFKQQGWKVVMASACRGDKNGAAGKNESIEETRKRESCEAAAIAGAESVILGFPDSEVFPGIALRKAIVDLVRRVKPEVVITHFPGDYHADHRTVADEVTKSVYTASSMGFKTAHKPVVTIPVIYCMEPLAGIGFLPSEYVDISRVMDMKLLMLKKHKSQFKAIKERGGTDILRRVADVAKFRGWQSGARYAEAFQLCQCWPNMKTWRTLP